MCRYILGVDVAKDSFDAAFWKEGMSRYLPDLPVRHFTRSPAGVKQLALWLASFGVQVHQPVLAVIDSTGRYSEDLAEMIHQLIPACSCAIINPFLLKCFAKSLGLRNKTDIVDCRTHCLFGVDRRPQPMCHVSAQGRALKELGRTRIYLVDLLIATKNRASQARCKQALAILRSLIKHTQHQIERVESQMENLVHSDAQLKRDFELLQSIPGVARVSGLAALAEVGDFRRFQSARQISGYSGLSPCRYQSGKHERRTSISRMGSPYLRRILHMPGIACITHGKSLKIIYRRLVARGLAKKAASLAVSRKILTIMWSVIVHQRPYSYEFHMDQLGIPLNSS